VQEIPLQRIGLSIGFRLGFRDAADR